MNRGVITVVSGLPRSGTSLLMGMLKAGGMDLLTDDIRTADEDNPKGYYEFERVKEIEHDQAWLKGAQGKVVKIISVLLKHLPQSYTYQVIFMRRKMEEILASQKQMLIRRGEPTDEVSDERIARISRQHLEQIETWIDEQPNIKVIYINYNDVLRNPAKEVKRVNRFLDNALSVKRMVKVVDQTPYRQQHSHTG